MRYGHFAPFYPIWGRRGLLMGSALITKSHYYVTTSNLTKFHEPSIRFMTFLYIRIGGLPLQGENGCPNQNHLLEKGTTRGEDDSIVLSRVQIGPKLFELCSGQNDGQTDRQIDGQTDGQLPNFFLWDKALRLLSSRNS